MASRHAAVPPLNSPRPREGGLPYRREIHPRNFSRRSGRDIGVVTLHSRFRRSTPRRDGTPGDRVIRSSGNIRQSGDRAVSTAPAHSLRRRHPSFFLAACNPFHPRDPGRIHRYWHPSLSRSDLSDCLPDDSTRYRPPLAFPLPARRARALLSPWRHTPFNPSSASRPLSSDEVRYASTFPALIPLLVLP